MILFRKIKKFLEYWFLSEGIKNAIWSMRSASHVVVIPEAPPKTFASLRAQGNIQFKDKHKGRRCFICATGPSINTQDLSALSDELCIGVSFFYLHPQISKINPAYHVFAPNHPPFDFDLLKSYFEGVCKHYTPTTEIFYGHRPFKYSVMDYIGHSMSLPPNPLHIIDYSQAPFLAETNCYEEDLWDISSRPFEIRTVIYSAIQMAVYMGCSPIYLLGCDHDYLNDLSRRDNHFYLEKNGNPQDASHLNEFSTEWWFYQYYCRWLDYRLMKQYCELHKIHIYNATAGGMLDVFPRCDYEEIICKDKILTKDNIPSSVLH